jgi:choline kinase
MKAVILAAGVGVRLRPLTLSQPKCLVTFRGKSLLRNQLEILEKVGLEECVIVLGHYGKMVVEHFGSRFGSMGITYVENPWFYQTNNLYSLWVARKEIQDEILLLESDLIFEYELIAEVLNAPRSDVAVTDKFQDGMDGTVVFEENDLIQSMILKANQPKGFNYSEAQKTVNVYRFGKNTVSELLVPNLTRFVELGRVNEFYESVLADLVANSGLLMYVHNVGNHLWAEIDNLQDLDRAEGIFNSLDSSLKSKNTYLN